MNLILWHLLCKVTFWEAHRLQKKFIKATKNFEATQLKVLKQKINRTKYSEFGKRYHFRQIHSIDDFQTRLPLCTYEDLVPYIERVKAGEVGALFHPKEKILMYALSSGTTSQPKTIPVTRPFLKEYKLGSLLWGVYCAQDHQGMLNGKILNIVSPTCEEKTPLGVPCGAISGLISETQKKVARQLYPVPGSVYQIKDVDVKDYLILRFSLGENVSLVNTANPSTLIRLARSAEKYKDRLVKDIYEGTLNPPGPLKEMTALQSKLSPQPRAGIRLQNLIQKGIPFTPRNFWPGLQVVACWKGGTLSSYLPQVRELYGKVPIRDLGLLASEARMTLPLQDQDSSGVLDLLSHFYEFIPEADADHPKPKTLLGHELQVGEKYFVVLTTSSGLYRYQIHDLVEVVDFFHQTPVLRFLNKGKSFSSVTGEKLSEYQVVQAVQCAASEQQLQLERFILAPQWGDPPHYALVVEEDYSIDKMNWDHFLIGMERELQKSNPEYQSKRSSKRLGAPVLKYVPKGVFQQLDAKTQKSRSGRVEQFKPCFLSNDLHFLEKFDMLLTSKDA